MKKFLKTIIVIGISIAALIIGGCVLMGTSGFLAMGLLGVASLFDDLPEGERKDSNGEIIHQDLRDTIVSFGKNKRFSIEKGVEIKPEEDTNDLFDREQNKDIDKIYDYVRFSPHVYTQGKKGYTKLNFETGEIQQSEDINIFSEKEQEIFKKLKSGKGNIKN